MVIDLEHDMMYVYMYMLCTRQLHLRLACMVLHGDKAVFAKMLCVLLKSDVIKL